MQLFLDDLERPTKCATAGERFRKIDCPSIKPQRIKAREPANRARQVHIGKNLLATMPLHINQYRCGVAAIMPPAPTQNSQNQPGEQDIIDARMKRRRHPRQQGRRDRIRQRQRQLSALALTSRPGSSAPSTRQTAGLLNRVAQNASSAT